MAMTKLYYHANEKRYSAAIEALDAAGKMISVEELRRPGGSELGLIQTPRGDEHRHIQAA